MNDIESFLLFLSYLLPFGGLMHIFLGIDTGESSQVVFGIVCIIISLSIMVFMICSAKKENQQLKYNARKIKLLVKMFRHIIISFILMIAEYLILWSFNFEIRQTILTIFISLVITTIIAHFLQKL